MKHCHDCKQDLSANAFNRDRKTSDGFNRRCRDCVSIGKKIKLKENRVHRKAMARAKRFKGAFSERVMHVLVTQGAVDFPTLEKILYERTEGFTDRLSDAIALLYDQGRIRVVRTEDFRGYRAA